MIMTLRTQLTAFLLFVAVLLAPLNSFAAEVASGGQSPSACQLLLPDCGADERGEQQDHQSANNTDDCCDSEETSADAEEPQLVCDMTANISASKLSHSYTTGHVPKVYLTIFIPPESCFRA
jgi:hypothetical protein